MNNSRFKKCIAAMICAALVAGILGRPASALVEALYTLKQVMEESKVIAEAVIESVDLKTKTIVVKVGNCLKGTTPIKEIKMNIGVGQEWYPEAMMKQAKVGEPVIVFYKNEGGGAQSECYTNNFFFQFNGDLNPKANWNFTHIEIRMNRTYNGTVQSLLEVLKNVVAGKAQPPPADKDIRPLTRSELMGLGAPALAVSDDVDGYEAFRDWKNEEWGNPTEAESVDFVDPGSPPDPGPQPGVLAEYYGIGEQIPDFLDLSARVPTVKRIDKQINLEPSSAPVPGTELANNFYARWTGIVRIAKAGKYRFFTLTDDGSRMLIDGKLVVNNPGDHATTEQSGEVELSAGDHDFKMEFWQNGGPYECRAYWQGPDIAKGPIPPEVFFHKGVFGSRGKILKIKLTDGPKGKLAVGRMLDADFSRAPRLMFEAENISEKAVKIAWGFQMKDGAFYESMPVDVAPGKWHYGLQVNFTLSNFKTAASEWKNTAEWANRNGLGKLIAVVYDSPKTGTLSLDRVRLEKGAVFVRSIPLAITGGRGLNYIDYDGDGNLDALLCSVGGNRLYQNRGNAFFEVTKDVGLTGGSRTATWVDLDGDGKPELLTGVPALFNFQNGKFVPNTKLIPFENKPLDCAGWLDANGDGKTDLLVAKGEGGLQLFLNEGAAFKDASDAFKLKGVGAGARNIFSLADVDGDGFVDVLVNHGKGLLLRGDDGKAFKADTKSKIEYASGGTMGTAFGDYDNDGAFDLFIPQPTKSLLLHNNNDGTFTNVTESAGAVNGISGNARSAAWGDVNLDGSLDLIVGFSDGPAMLFLGDGKGKFIASPFSLQGFDCANGTAGIALGDFDNDGDLDLLVMSEKTAGIIVNESPRTDRVPLRIRPSTKSAPGMLVRLYDANDKPLGIRQPGLVSNIGSQDPFEAFFAVAPGKYKVAVLFTDGESRENVVNVPKEGLTLNVEEAKKK